MLKSTWVTAGFFSLFLITFKTTAVEADSLRFSLELHNTLNNSVFVHDQEIAAGSKCKIDCIKRNNEPLFIIGHEKKQYHVYCDSCSELDLSDIKLDVATICFLAADAKKHKGFDEICLHNDTHHDVVVRYTHKISDPEVIKKDLQQNGITVEPGQFFHKNVYCTVNKSGTKTLRCLGLLALSMVTHNDSKSFCSLAYPRRVYNDSSLVGTRSWNVVKLSAETIKLFDKGFSVKCS